MVCGARAAGRPTPQEELGAGHVMRKAAPALEEDKSA